MYIALSVEFLLLPLTTLTRLFSLHFHMLPIKKRQLVAQLSNHLQLILSCTELYRSVSCQHIRSNLA